MLYFYFITKSGSASWMGCAADETVYEAIYPSLEKLAKSQGLELMESATDGRMDEA